MRSRHESEADFVRTVLDAAAVLGWRRIHFRPARTQHGWRTPLQGDVGFPDLVLARPGAPLLLVEVKTDTGRLTPAQEAWLATLRQARGHQALVWRPAQWAQIVQLLQTGRSRQPHEEK